MREAPCINCGKELNIFEQAYLDSKMCYGCDAQLFRQQKLF